MHDDTQTYSLMEKRKIVKSLHSLIERLSPNDAVMLIGNIREYWHVYL